jgi:hypothetical protein
MRTANTFDSHAILVKHYVKKIERWNWNQLLTDAESNMQLDEWGNKNGQAWLGTAIGMSPSGKIYTCWTSNQTRSDIRRDEAFYDALDMVANAKGGLISWEDDSCFFLLPPLDCASTVEDEIDDAAYFDSNE